MDTAEEVVNKLKGENMKHCLDRENGCNPYGDACSCGCNICMRIPQMEIEIVQGKESLLDLEIKRIEQAFVEKEKQLQKMKTETMSEARRNGILQGIDKVYPEKIKVK